VLIFTSVHLFSQSFTPKQISERVSWSWLLLWVSQSTDRSIVNTRHLCASVYVRRSRNECGVPYLIAYGGMFINSKTTRYVYKCGDNHIGNQRNFSAKIELLNRVGIQWKDWYFIKSRRRLRMLNIISFRVLLSLNHGLCPKTQLGLRPKLTFQ